MALVPKKTAFRLLLALWLAVTFAALAGMWQLWQQRERVLYLGKSLAQQRETVFQRAGLPAELVRQTAELARQWPPDIRYQAKGDANALSYVQYLLIPRIPAKDAGHVLKVKGKELTAAGQPPSAPRAEAQAAEPERASPKGLLLSFAVLLGWAALLRKIWRSRITWPEALALACLFFTLLVLPVRFFFLAAQPAFGGAIVLALVGWATLLANVLLSLMQKSNAAQQQPILNRRGLLFDGLLAAIIAASLLWSFFMAAAVVPDDWDAWAIWGSKAKVLALGSGPLEDVTKFGHADYPLLWPVVWAFSGWLAGGWEECWSKGWGALFLLLCVWEMIALVRQHSGSRTVGLLAAALFVSVPNVPLIASWAYAEAPLWLMMLCGLASLLRWQREGRRADAVLAGLFAAAAAHTKNEGLLFAALLGLLLLLFSGQQRKAALLFPLAFVLAYLPWFWWSRLHLDLAAAAAPQQLDAAVLRRAASRIVPAMQAIFGMWKDVRQWNIVGALLGLAVLRAVFKHRPGTAALLLPAGLLAGYFTVILLNHNEIYWQIGTAWNRLTVQTLPLFIALLAVQEAQNKRQD